MKNIETAQHSADLITYAESDDGRYTYSAIADAIRVDGRHIYQGHYLGQDGLIGDRVSDEDRAGYMALVKEVDASREAWHAAAYERSIDRMVDREEFLGRMAKNLRGGYLDEGTI